MRLFLHTAIALLLAFPALAQSTKQISQFSAASSIASTDKLLLQQGGTGTAYTYGTVSQILSAGVNASFGTLAASGNVAINTNKFNITASSGNTTVAGTLGVTGATTGTANITGGNGAQAVEIGNNGSISMVRAAGTGTNLDLRSGSTAGLVRIRNSGLSNLGVFDVNGVGTPVNYFTFAPAGTGNGPQLMASGTDTDVDIRLTPKGAGVVKVTTLENTNGTITLSGSTDNVKPIKLSANLAGTESGLAAGIDTRGSHLYVAVSSDTAAYPDGVLNIQMIAHNLAAGWTGGRRAYGYQVNTTGATTLNSSAEGFVGIGGQVYGNHNLGGSSSGFGLTQNGYGAIFGANPRVKLGTGGTYYNGVVGTEIGAEMLSGSSASYFAVLQLVLEQSHAAHGTTRDSMLMFGAQAGASAGAKEIMLVGSGAGEWPGDPDGYLLTARRGNDPDSAALAGGIDLQTIDFSGTGVQGGGFAWRSPGMSITSTGAVQAGFGKIDGSSGGMVLSAPYSTLSGTPTVSAGGSGYTVGEVLGDVYGNIVKVATLSGSAVATVSVIKRGWTSSTPGGAVAFSSLNSTAGTKGSGAELNTSWSAGDTIKIDGKFQIGTASLTLTAGAVGLPKMTASASAPGAGGGKIELVCGTNAGSAKLVAYAGTSSTAVTILDNIGSGVTGC